MDPKAAPAGAPTSGTSIIGYDVANGTYVELHADDRGVYRVYQMGLRDGVWTLWREGSPVPQRFSGSFSANGGMITGRWEARDGKTWTTDFEVIFTRVT